LDKRSSPSMIPPLRRDIDVQMCGIVAAEIADGLEIFNVTEMGEFRRVLEAACEVPDDESRLIKRNKETIPVSLDISPERSLAEDVFFLLARKKLLCARLKKNIVYFTDVTDKITELICFFYVRPHVRSSSS